MKSLHRNKQTFWYCLYVGKTDILDSDNNITGDYNITYQDAVQTSGSISAARGEAQNEMFGGDLRYDKVIIMDDPDCPIDEHTVLFVDKEPEYRKNNDNTSDSSTESNSSNSDSDEDDAVEDPDEDPDKDDIAEVPDEKGEPLFDYIVKRAARSLNCVSYAIEKVNVS